MVIKKKEAINFGKDLDSLRNYLRKLRIERGLSLRGLANEINIPQSTIHDLETNRRDIKKINKNYLDALQVFYDVKIECSEDILRYTVFNARLTSFFDERQERYNQLRLKLKELRLKRGLSTRQVELASGKQISHSYLIEIEKGRYRISEKHIKILADIYRFDVNKLFSILYKKMSKAEKLESLKTKIVKEDHFDYKYLGEYLRYYRLKAGLSKKKVIKLFDKGLNINGLTKIEECYKLPSEEHLKKFSEIYKVDYDGLLKLKNARIPLRKKASKTQIKKDLLLLELLIRGGVQKWSGYVKVMEDYGRKIEYMLLEEELEKERTRESKR